ncbi:FRAS1-related extracellular matrix protein 1-like protein [Lates japonicus]|uniref:FRAS1-related extracellular matrix protein 1 n=1 Tax=Lates japonicus TaxID=270547 RepID=A0AAD3N9Y5_LATJO|nr:FRAS1-related extracellular matrix protein 1-like protein [Lates japonicus]
MFSDRIRTQVVGEIFSDDDKTMALIRLSERTITAPADFIFTFTLPAYENKFFNRVFRQQVSFSSTDLPARQPQPSEPSSSKHRVSHRRVIHPARSERPEEPVRELSSESRQVDWPRPPFAIDTARLVRHGLSKTPSHESYRYVGPISPRRFASVASSETIVSTPPRQQISDAANTTGHRPKAFSIACTIPPTEEFGWCCQSSEANLSTGPFTRHSTQRLTLAPPAYSTGGCFLAGDGRYGIFLSSRELKAQDSDSREEELIFCIVRPPYFGYLENITTGGFVPQRFSQTELNKRTIVYIISPERESLSDSLEFRVSDPLGNTGPSHILEFSWSNVELSQPEYSVCEEQGGVSLDIIRKGNLAESSYITVKLKAVTATAGKDFLISPSSLVQFDPGVSKRSWQIEIIRDHLEEAEEMFEVLLISPEGTVIGTINRAQVTIRDSGQCRLNQDQEAPVLGGKEIRSDTYPQHGSIQLEKLPLGTESVIWARGDSVSRPASLPKKKLRVTGNPKSIAPSSVFHNGTDIVYTYHGIMQMQVEDDTSPSRKGRKANIRVVSRGAPQQVSAVPTESKLDPKRKVSKPQKSGLAKVHATADNSIPKPCVPELMGLLHFNQTTNQLFHCNGVSWKPWAPTDQMVSAQMCPQGWTFHGGYCYILSTEHKATWSTANRACRERYKGTLASVLSKVDMDWLWNFSGRKPFWIGLNDREGRGRWEWAGGEPVSYTNWRKTPPRSKMKGTKKCVLVWRRAKWQIRDCKTSRGHRFVCSVKT